MAAHGGSHLTSDFHPLLWGELNTHSMQPVQGTLLPETYPLPRQAEHRPVPLQVWQAFAAVFEAIEAVRLPVPLHQRQTPDPRRSIALMILLRCEVVTH